MDEDSDESWVAGGEGEVVRSAGGEGEREKSESGDDIGESERRRSGDDDLEGMAAGVVEAEGPANNWGSWARDGVATLEDIEGSGEEARDLGSGNFGRGQF